MTFNFIKSPNFGKRKHGQITAIVIHYTGSLSIEGTIAWFKSKFSEVSVHYLIGRFGEVVKMVEEDDKAWHCGNSAMNPSLPLKDPKRESNVNDFSLGIELVATPDSGYTDKQMAALYEVLEYLVDKYKIPPERVVGHSHISPGRKIDPEGFPPGQFNWEKVRKVCKRAYERVI